MEKVTITMEEYEKLKMQDYKIRLIDEAIHKDFSIQKLMEVQEKQESLDFLKAKGEDIYTIKDLKETWKKEQ